MEKFEALKFTEDEIQLKSDEDLNKLYKEVDEEHDFILSWEKDGEMVSEVILATHVSAKVKNAEIKLTARRKMEE